MLKEIIEAVTIGFGMIALSTCSVVEMCCPDAFFQSEPKHANLIDLSSVYKGGEQRKLPIQPIYIDDGEGNFVRLVSDEVIFFSPKVLPMFRAALQGKAKSFKIRIERYANGVKPSTYQLARVKAANGELLIDGVAVQRSDLDRLGLSPDFECFYEEEERPCRSHRKVFPGRSSLLRIRDSVFLITGGMGQNGECSKTAVLYDIATNTVIKKFDLRRKNYDHISLLLSDGKVLLLNGRNSELLDLERETSEVFDDLDFENRCSVTACLDENDDCWIFGGDGNLKTVSSVEKFSPNRHTLSKKRDLISGRTSGGSGGYYSSKINAVLMANGSFLISGGTVWTPNQVYLSRFNSAAEIYWPDK